MVDAKIDWEKRTATVTASGREVPFIITHTRIDGMYVINMSKGPTPKVLSGSYSSIPNAVAAVEKYVLANPETETAGIKRVKEKYGARAGNTESNIDIR